MINKIHGWNSQRYTYLDKNSYNDTNILVSIGDFLIFNVLNDLEISILCAKPQTPLFNDGINGALQIPEICKSQPISLKAHKVNASTGQSQENNADALR